MPRRALLAGALLLLALPAPAAAATFSSVSNRTPISIPSVGPGSPYPSAVSISGLKGSVSEVSATLSGVTHEAAFDIDALLVAPSGQSVLLMSNRCNNVVDATFSFSDFAAGQLPTLGQSCPSGSYRPAGGTPQTVPPSANAPRGGQLSLFNGQQPNGPWKLFVSDTRATGSGTIAGGWSLSVSSRVGAKCKHKNKHRNKAGRCVKKKKHHKKHRKKKGSKK